MKKRYAKPLTPEQLAALPDDQIDTSDIPELDEAFWANATLKPPQTKPNVSLRVSEEVIAFFKADSPKGYTARMAAVLTAYVNAHRTD
ncbi:MAG: BrnA antitoxin family protein [Rhodospirillaceae bacterium]